MRTSAKVLLLLTLVLSFAASTVAQEAMWEELSTEAVMLYQRGQYSEAAKVAEEALKLAEETFGPPPPEVATVCQNAADCYRRLGKASVAEELESRARKIRSKQ